MLLKNKLKFYKLKKKKLFSNYLDKRINNQYHICLLKNKKKPTSVYRIAVLNWNRRKVDIIGVYIPDILNTQNLNIHGTFLKNYTGTPKTIKINFPKAIFWLKKGCTLSPFLHFILKGFLLKPYFDHKKFQSEIKFKDNTKHQDQDKDNINLFFFEQIESFQNL
jgi:hypothetical protein